MSSLLVTFHYILPPSINLEAVLRESFSQRGLKIIEIRDNGGAFSVWLENPQPDTRLEWDVALGELARLQPRWLPVSVYMPEPISAPPAPPQPEYLKQIQVLAGTLNVRASPLTGGVIRTVSRGAVLPVYEVDLASGWYRISLDKQEWVTHSPAYVSDV